MQPVEIQVPSLGESIHEVIVGAILKENGSHVTQDEELLELETDKVNQVLYAPATGILQLTVRSGDVIPIGRSVGTILPKAQATSKGNQESLPSEKKKEQASTPPQRTAKAVATSVAPEQGGANLRISREKALQALKAPARSTPLQPAVESAQAPYSRPIPESRVGPSPSSIEEVSRQKMPRMRQVIAQRLVAAQHAAAMLTTFNEVDLTAVIAIRDRHKEPFAKEHGVKLGFMSFFVRAVVSGLRAFPMVNSAIEGDEILTYHRCHIGVAVSTDKGLVVPVIRTAENCSLAEIERQIALFAEKARAGRLSLDELQGGTFTITNGGVFGSLLSTPILNSPQSGILGMHAIQKRVVVVDNQPAVRPMMYLALSYDHRLIDGKEAVSFLVHLKKVLEDPYHLLLGT